MWDQDAPSLAEAQAYSYRYVPDEGTTSVPLDGVTCAAATPGPYVCQVPFPAFTPAAHTLVLVASNDAGASVPSTPLAFVFVVVPAPPRNPRIVRP